MPPKNPASSPRFRHRFRLRDSAVWLIRATLFLSFFGCNAGSPPLPSDFGSVSPAVSTDPEAIARQYVEVFQEQARLKSQLHCLDASTVLFADGRAAYQELAGFRGISDEGQGQLTAAFDAAGAHLLEAVHEWRHREGAETDRLIDQWTSLRGQRNQAEIQLAEAEATKRTGGQLATLLNLDNRWFWLAALVAFASLAAVAIHERRHEVRRLMHGDRARAMSASIVLQAFVLVLLLATVIVFVFGNRIYARLVGSGAEGGLRTISAMNEEVQVLQASTNDLKTQLAAAIDTLGSPGAKAILTDEGTAESDTATPWPQMPATLFAASVEAGVKSHMAAGLAADMTRMQSLSQEFNNSSAAIHRYRSLKWLVKLAFGLAFLGAVGTSGWTLLRSLQRRKQLIADTCPLCLGVAKFRNVSDSSMSRRNKVELLRCANVLSEQPHEECEFEFLSVYRDMPKLCFPTLGHAQAGKTHWLAMLYRELNRGNFNSRVQFDKVKSRSSEEFDRTVNDILNARMTPSATQTDRLPHPLIFNFCDNDRFGRSSTLVNIFDYSGEVTTSRSLDDPHRRRALDADGYLFFLDPTYLAEPQADALVNFREDVRAISGIRAGRAIRSPVALCVSKIDLLPSQPFAGSGDGGPIEAFYRTLREIDPTGTDFSLRAIKARSQLIASLRDTIWPGWQIERQIHDLFGGRFMFFPLTPVGLSELGETDLRLRMIEPFGILEPLAWLLHMNGYPVLR